MRSAPSVSYPVGRSRLAGSLMLTVWLAGLVVTGLWCVQGDSLGWRQGLAVAAVLATGAAAARAWGLSPAGVLSWDGQHWLWTTQGVQTQVTLTVPLDLQRRLLLCLHPPAARVRWVWLERRRRRERWDDLRRAVYSRAASAGLQEGEPGSGAAAP